MMTWYVDDMDDRVVYSLNSTGVVTVMFFESCKGLDTLAWLSQVDIPADAKWEKCRVMNWGRLFCDVQLTEDNIAYHHVPRRFIRPLPFMLQPMTLRSGKKKKRSRSRGCTHRICPQAYHVTAMSTSGCVTQLQTRKIPMLTKNRELQMPLPNLMRSKR